MALVLVVLAFAVGVAIVMGGYGAVTKLPQVMQQRTLDRPAVSDPPHVALELAMVELFCHARRIVADGAAAGKAEASSAAASR